MSDPLQPQVAAVTGQVVRFKSHVQLGGQRGMTDRAARQHHGVGGIGVEMCDHYEATLDPDRLLGDDFTLQDLRPTHEKVLFLNGFR